MSDLRVAILNPCFWPEVQRGSERILRDLATDLIRHGHSPRLITSHPGLPRSSVEDGLPITRHWRPPEGMLMHRGGQEYLTHLPFSYASLVRGSDDVAHAFFPTDAVVGSRWAARTGRPAVFTYGGIPERAVLASRRWRQRVLAEAIGRSDAVTAYSRAAADALRRWFGIEATVVHPGVRLEQFEVSSARDEHPTIACAAAVDDPRKRIELLVAAFRHVRRARPDARLMLVRPRDAARARELEDHGVELFAPDPGAVAQVFQRAWVSALASRNEAFGLVLVESLACGTPVVAARDGGVPEIVDRDEIGRLFDGGEAELARALLEALELAGDPATVGACRERAAAFTTERGAREYIALYRELIERGRPGRAS